MKKLKDYPATCENCRHWHEHLDPADTDRWGLCKRYPGVPVIDEDDAVQTILPIKAPDDLCGEFGAKQ